MNSDVVFIASQQVVGNNSKVNWPDLNYPGSNLTVLRYLHAVDYEKLRVKLDSVDSPWIEKDNLPFGTGFFKRL